MLKLTFIKNLTKQEREKLLLRSRMDIESIKPYVAKIVEDIRRYGDEALLKYTALFDKASLTPEGMRVSEEEVQAAYGSTSKEMVEAFEKAARNIEAFHRQQLPSEIWLTKVEEGVMVGRIWRPISSVGLYVPGGRASYPSTVLMMAIPARIANVPKVIMCTPPMPNGGVNPLVLVAARIAGVDEVYKAGGPQAIAAMAYGTETIPKVDKIVGPGNVYVTAAKMLVYGHVDVDFPAGPSEILILADESANPEFIVRDLISQAEHDADASSILVTTSMELAEKVYERLEEVVGVVKRSEIVLKSLERYGAILIAEDLEEAIDFVNEYAPEHLEIMASSYGDVLDKVRNAGSIFIGSYSTVSLGDYCTGANHVLPTGGVAKFRSGLSIDDFIKRPTIQLISYEGLKKLKDTAAVLANAEGLPSHAEAVEARLKE